MIPRPPRVSPTDRATTGSWAPTLPSPHHWDEMCSQDGRIRPTYEWVEHLVTMDPEGCVWRDLVAPQGNDTGLDRLPLIVSSHDWTLLERGLRQRAILLDRLLQDAYGPQESIQAGWLPAGVVYACPRFLRTAHDGTPNPGRLLRFHAVDLVRRSDGTWQVVADRTGLPGGLGLALMGLVGSADALRGVLDELGSRAAMRFAAVLHGAWEGSSGRALLVPEGMHDDVDLGWLARGLSWAVVDDADLLFRGDHLHRVTPSGFERIELLVQADGCTRKGFVEPARGRDPGRIDLSGNTTRGNLQRINPPGSDLMESPAWMPFLPRLCQRVLDEDLILPSVPTWWCGDRQSLRHVEDSLGRLEVESVVTGRAGFLKPRLPIGSDDELRIRRHLDLRPECWVAQEPLQPSWAPWTSNEGLVGRPTVLRMFAIETPNGWQVLPGGLAYAFDGDGTTESNRSSMPQVKTVWVDPGADRDRIPLPAYRTRTHRPGPDPILSLGMAHRLIRLGRTWSRCDHGCRCIRAILERSGDGVAKARDPVVRILSTHLLRHLGIDGEDPLVERGSGAGLRETRPPMGVPKGWFHELCDPFLDQTGPCQAHLPVGLRGLVERLRDQLQEVLATAGRDGLEDLPVVLEALRGSLLTGFDEDAAGRFLSLGWHWDQALHAGTLLLDLLGRHPHPLPGLGQAVDSILGIGGSRSHRPVLVGRACGGIPDRIWHPTDPGALLQRLFRIRDGLDRVQGHSPGLLLSRSRQAITEAVIEAERAGTSPIGFLPNAEETIRRIVIRVRRAHEDFSDEFNDLLN
jgi:uncharacterized circularly permuted ATP-grasp superfamily protein